MIADEFLKIKKNAYVHIYTMFCAYMNVCVRMWVTVDI